MPVLVVPTRLAKRVGPRHLECRRMSRIRIAKATGGVYCRGSISTDRPSELNPDSISTGRAGKALRICPTRHNSTQVATMLRQLRPRSAFKRSPSRLIANVWETSRSYSIQAESASTIKLQEIDPSKLSITKSTTPKELVPPNELVFGRTFTGIIGFRFYTATLTPIRPYAQSRMDCVRWMACPTNYPLSKPLSRPLQLCLPLCVRMFRGNEGIQR
jgi:hypothetical protein